MHYYQNGTETEVIGLEGFNLQRTFECGQCFRWNSDGTGAYVGVAKGKAARIRRDGGSVFITGTPDDFRAVWRVYFDLDRNYESIRSALCVDDYMKRCAQYGAGIRILKQDKWESLCTFIVSQCNNIPRIKQIVERFSRLFGEPVTLDGHTYYTFPTAERTALLSERISSAVGRADIRRARAVRGAADRGLRQGTHHAIDAKNLTASVTRSRGAWAVRLHILDAFPVDTWIKKAVTENYGDTFDPAVFSPYAGIAQQYMFHYARSKKS
jgi:N-glycosylase/DNA lyase